MFTERSDVAIDPDNRNDALVPETYRVTSVRQDLADTFSLEMSPVSATRPGFEPGQFNMLYAFGIGEIPISISGSSTDGVGYLHTIRAVGAVSRTISHLSAGDQLGIRGPFGTGWPVARSEGADVVFVAGGLGLAPLRPAILEVLEHRTRYGRVVILSGSRSPADILFRHELERWRQRLDIDIEVTVDHADRTWHGHVGVVPALLARADFDPGETVAFVCGPEIMMRFAARHLHDAGVPDEHIFLSMERNMKCAVGHCGHCQFGPDFICLDGPVLSYDRIGARLSLREV
jgi:NAD(P)H-flavin reductase